MSNADVPKLPPSWALTDLQTVAEINPALDKSAYGDALPVSFVPMPAMEAGTGIVDVSATRPFGEVKKGFTPFVEGDVLFAKITPCMENGKMAVVPTVKNGLGFGSTEFHVLRPRPGIDPRYIYYFISSQRFRRDAEHNMTGAVGQRRVPASHIAEHPLPLAPTREQTRIVDKISVLSSGLDSAVESLRKALAQVKYHRQAVLKHAFEGKLTADWRASHPATTPQMLITHLQDSRESRYRDAVKRWESSRKKAAGTEPLAQPKKPSVVPVPTKTAEDLRAKFPDTWAIVSVSEASAHIVDCLHSTPTFVSRGRPCIDSTCIEDNKLLRDRLRFVDDETYVDRIQRMKPEIGDVILVREGSKKIGTCLVVTFDLDFCLGQRMMMFRLESSIVPQFFCYYVQSLQFRRQYKPLIGGSASPHLNIGDIKVMGVPLCDTAEQLEIVNRLDAVLSRIDQLEEDIQHQIAETDALRESVLKRAFSGQLVEQDAGDESALILLERIKDGLKARTTAKTRSKRKTKAA